MSEHRYNDKLSRTTGSSDQFTQSVVRGDPCSLSKAMDVLNSYADLSNKAYIKMPKVLQQKDNRVVFMCMPKYRRKCWIEDILNPEEDWWCIVSPMSKLFGFYVLWIRVVLFTFILCFVWIIQRFMLFMNLGCLYGLCYIMWWIWIWGSLIFRCLLWWRLN